MKQKLIEILTYMGADMSAWAGSDKSQPLSPDHVARLDKMKSEHEQLTTDKDQLTTDLAQANTDKATAETALSNAMITTKAVAGALSLDIKEGETLSETISNIATKAGAEPGASEHSSSISGSDATGEDDPVTSSYAHNKAADDAIG